MDFRMTAFWRAYSRALAAAAMLCLTACGTSHVLIGGARAPMAPDRVKIYLEPISRKYEEIAVVRASSRYSLSLTAVGKGDVVIRRLQEEAARLGANGVLLQEISTANHPVGAGIGTDLSGDHGTLGIGVGTSVFDTRYGSGIAVYVDPD
jgi:hypothetical protein